MAKTQVIYGVVSTDDYELPEFVGTIEEVAEYSGSSISSIRSSICHAKQRGYKSKFVRIYEEKIGEIK